MGFLGKVFKGIGKVVGGIAKGIVKFAKSPLGKLVMNIGLSLLTGGVGGIAAKLGGSLLGKLASSAVGKVFTGVADKFLGSATNLLSKTGISALSSFVDKAGSVSDLAGMAKDLLNARQQSQQVDATTNQMANLNTAQLFAQRQAELVTQSA